VRKIEEGRERSKEEDEVSSAVLVVFYIRFYRQNSDGILNINIFRIFISDSISILRMLRKELGSVLIQRILEKV
jgi:hypothetical protein